MPSSRSLPSSMHEARGLRRIHAGHRLVEQQHGRLGRERERDAEQPLVAIGQGAGKLMRAVLDADERKDFPGGIAQLALGRRARAAGASNVSNEVGAAAQMQAVSTFSNTLCALEHAGALERADQPECRRLRAASIRSATCRDSDTSLASAAGSR